MSISRNVCTVSGRQCGYTECRSKVITPSKLVVALWWCGGSYQQGWTFKFHWSSDLFLMVRLKPHVFTPFAFYHLDLAPNWLELGFLTSRRFQYDSNTESCHVKPAVTLKFQAQLVPLQDGPRLVILSWEMAQPGYLTSLYSPYLHCSIYASLCGGLWGLQ